jgi:ribosomal protein S6E (S10)
MTLLFLWMMVLVCKCIGDDVDGTSLPESRGLWKNKGEKTKKSFRGGNPVQKEIVVADDYACQTS